MLRTIYFQSLSNLVLLNEGMILSGPIVRTMVVMAKYNAKLAWVLSKKKNKPILLHLFQNMQ